MAEICDHLGVMYGGRMMEAGPIDEVLHETANPYTLGLKNSFPTVKQEHDLVSIPGSPPTLRSPEPQCRFADRCPFAIEECWGQHPQSYSVAAARQGQRIETESHEHRSACYRVTEIDELARAASEEDTWQQTDEMTF